MLYFFLISFCIIPIFCLGNNEIFLINLSITAMSAVIIGYIIISIFFNGQLIPRNYQYFLNYYFININLKNSFSILLMVYISSILFYILYFFIEFLFKNKLLVSELKRMEKIYILSEYVNYEIVNDVMYKHLTSKGYNVFTEPVIRWNINLDDYIEAIKSISLEIKIIEINNFNLETKVIEVINVIEKINNNVN